MVSPPKLSENFSLAEAHVRKLPMISSRAAIAATTPTTNRRLDAGPTGASSAALAAGAGDIPPAITGGIPPGIGCCGG
ncbi:hypothetical protein GCM10023217_01390 [Gordonia alkaliphila]|uniref:Uncharacterized protein n=1 Tax=Gordonia alkaliphila TaxID=1053547 RepID=A0ABP8YRT2_9ACTN